LTQMSITCLERLLQHQPPSHFRGGTSNYPRSMLAAVLVLLYEKAGSLRVLLTTRSKSLRSHPFQTALPGGKFDYGDNDMTTTAVSYVVLICISKHHHELTKLAATFRYEKPMRKWAFP
jgi:8-oxo-dGTP pyrophosphatase MutT (NUDIX family)